MIDAVAYIASAIRTIVRDMRMFNSGFFVDVNGALIIRTTELLVK